MKRLFCAFVSSILVLTFCSVASAGHHYYYHGYRGYHPNYHRSHRHFGGAELATGLILGGLVGAAINSQPRTTVYQAPVVVQSPTCVLTQVVSGEYQIIEGQRVWVRFPYPMKRQYQVPCN